METSTVKEVPGWVRQVKRAVLKTVFGILLLGAAGFALWSWASLRFVYSTGERSGFVQKFSKRGWIFKTYEGELSMVNLPGALPEIFTFTVRDEKVVSAIERSMGQRVVLSYHQHRGVPARVFGDTAYFVFDVRPVASADLPVDSALPRSEDIRL